MPAWPVGVRSKGNEGVTASIKTTPGSIAYVEYGYAKNQNVPMASLENKAGQYVAPSTASGQAALKSAKMPENLVVWASDPEASDAYPIVTYTWMILYKQYPDQHKRDALRDFIKFAATDGQQSAEQLGYIPLPSEVADKVVSATDNVKVAAKN
jgi:phosphate transport system substrate-binding protein